MTRQRHIRGRGRRQSRRCIGGTVACVARRVDERWGSVRISTLRAGRVCVLHRRGCNGRSAVAELSGEVTAVG
eukprot:3702321-Pleurochrysis_carterae.AAC.3